MSDIMLTSVLSMSYPDNVTDLDQLSWFQLKCRLKYAASRIDAENLIADEIQTIIKKLWFDAYSYGPSNQQIVGNEIIATADIVQRVTNPDLDEIIKKLQSIQRRLSQ